MRTSLHHIVWSGGGGGHRGALLSSCVVQGGFNCGVYYGVEYANGGRCLVDAFGRSRRYSSSWQYRRNTLLALVCISDSRAQRRSRRCGCLHPVHSGRRGGHRDTIPPEAPGHGCCRTGGVTFTISLRRKLPLSALATGQLFIGYYDTFAGIKKCDSPNHCRWLGEHFTWFPRWCWMFAQFVLTIMNLLQEAQFAYVTATAWSYAKGWLVTLVMSFALTASSLIVKLPWPIMLLQKSKLAKCSHRLAGQFFQ